MSTPNRNKNRFLSARGGLTRPPFTRLAGLGVVLVLVLAACGATAEPAAELTAAPPAVAEPTTLPTAAPTAEAAVQPTAAPTAAQPTAAPTAAPTTQPTAAPTAAPTSEPAAPSAALPTVVAGDEAEVEIEDFQFQPKVLVIHVGTEVKWSNKDETPHTATSDSGVWDSGYLNKGDDFFFTFTEPGTYPYYCIPHGGPNGVGMSGTIVVVE